MKQVNRIIEHPAYKEALAEIAIREENRIFCRHNTEHFMNVARIAMILNLEEDKDVDISSTMIKHPMKLPVQSLRNRFLRTADSVRKRYSRFSRRFFFTETPKNLRSTHWLM